MVVNGFTRIHNFIFPWTIKLGHGTNLNAKYVSDVISEKHKIDASNTIIVKSTMSNNIVVL